MNATDYSTIKLTPREKALIEPHMSSWRATYPATKDMQDTEKNLETIAKMIAWEIQNPDGARRQLLNRLLMRLNAMRNRLEYVKLMKHAKR